MKTSRLSRVLCSLMLLFAFFVPVVSVAAEEIPEVKASMTISAVVPTKACAQYSSIVSNVSEILSDLSQRGTITVKVYDCTNTAVSGASVVLISNRGAIDRINQVSATGVLMSSGDGQGLAALTDANGYLFYQVYSNVPGESLYKARVDGQLDIGQVKIVYLPLPFPKNISVVVEVPKLLAPIIAPSGEITIFRPKDYDIDPQKLVNLTMELRIPAWVFYFVLLIVLANILMFVTILVLTWKIKRTQSIEIADLEADKKLLEKEESEIGELVEAGRATKKEK